MRDTQEKCLKTKCCHPGDTLYISGPFATSYVTGDLLCLVLIQFGRHSIGVSTEGAWGPLIYNSQPRCTLAIWKLRCQNGHASASVMICSTTGGKMLRSEASPLPPGAPVTVWSKSPANKQPLHPGQRQALQTFPKCFTDFPDAPLWTIISGPIPSSLQNSAVRGCSLGQVFRGLW